MRDKNVRRAARALFLSQGDDKNATLSKYITDPKVRQAVKDQGRALIVLEKLVLPQGKDDYDEEFMYQRLMWKLKKKGHRIQGDEEEDTPQYAAEKERYVEARSARVPSIYEALQIEPKEEKEKEEPKPSVPQPVKWDDGVCECPYCKYHTGYVPKTPKPTKPRWKFW